MDHVGGAVRPLFDPLRGVRSARIFSDFLIDAAL